jgi:hypothetical protein
MAIVSDKAQYRPMGLASTFENHNKINEEDWHLLNGSPFGGSVHGNISASVVTRLSVPDSTAE